MKTSTAVSISLQTYVTTLNEFTAVLPTSGFGAILDGAAATYHKSHPSREWRVTPLSQSVSDINVH